MIDAKMFFDNYCKQFADRYKARRGADGIWEILCKNGDIEPYSITELCCYQEISRRAIIGLKKRLPKYCTVTQEGIFEIVFKFPNEHLDEIAALVGAIKRRKLSDKEKARLAEIRKPFLFKKHGAKTPDNRLKSSDRQQEVPEYPSDPIEPAHAQNEHISACNVPSN